MVHLAVDRMGLRPPRPRHWCFRPGRFPGQRLGGEKDQTDYGEDGKGIEEIGPYNEVTSSAIYSKDAIIYSASIHHRLNSKGRRF